MIVQINDTSITVPQSWNAMPLKQQYYCYQAIMTDTGGLFEDFEVLPAKRIQLAMYLLNVDQAFMNKWEEDCIQADGEEDGTQVFLDELAEVLQITNFFFEQVEGEAEQQKFQIHLGLTKCPYPIMSIPKRLNTKGKKDQRWFAPADGLANITIYELGVTFTLFEAFMNTRDEAKANELLAVLYRPKKRGTQKNKRSAYQGDKRLPYLNHEATVKQRLPFINALPLASKQLILFWFASCRAQIIEQYSSVFQVPDDVTTDKNEFGWGSVLLSLAGGLVNLEQVARQKYSNALTYLAFLEQERKKALLKSVSF